MNFDIVNPLEIPDWDELVLATGKASVFHSSAWARVLHESYGYKPLYFASIENGKMASLMSLMEVNSRLTGKRGVSLPFTDQVSLIAQDKAAFEKMIKGGTDYGEKAGWKYVEWRDGSPFPEGVCASESNYTHELNLLKAEKELFSGFRDSTRRNIKKAAKAGVSVGIGQSLDSIRSFYRLNCITRKRHGLPPQPLSFFDKIFEHVISKDHGIVASALNEGKVVASAVFFHFARGAVYKYGASDLAHQELRANNLVMWEAIKWFREKGFKTLNFGRTEPNNKGLLQFKRGWNAEERQLRYFTYDLKKKAYKTDSRGVRMFQNQIFNFTPVPVLRFVGSALYKHLG